MASSVWSALEGATTVATAAGSTVVADPGALLNHQLASALSTMGDAQYWEETISPATIRQSLQDVDPSNPGSVSTVLRAMKWLLAAISKGRDVSDFYPLVVKLVGFVHSLEVRKMVYMYLVQYADYDAQTRELSLLSINSFQRGMADAEALIRALALRVLTSIHISDILQIQILGVQKCAQDASPYVRKCAANALSKLYPRCDAQQQELLLEIMTHELLDKDTATMVLTSALIAMSELVPDRLELLHHSFRKICHLLTDMDEWGQVVVIDLLARYCRRFFKAPASWRDGTAERIDKERRVRRTLAGIITTTISTKTNSTEEISSSTAMADTVGGSVDTQTSALTTTLADQAALSGVALPPRVNGTPRKVKRRVVKKGFYSDEEDESTEEEVYADTLTGQPVPSLAAAMKQNILLGGTNAVRGASGAMSVSKEKTIDVEELELDPDHRMLLQAAMPLLKSRNAGVVLAVCSLQYYCGISSVRVRSAMGKALVRIHRDKREIQYVVLQSIRTLVTECPSAFAPFLHDFFVKAMDPPFTRLIKLDILTSLALEPRAIEVVLKELRLYVRDGDKAFSCAAVHAVGKIAELARIVFDRHGSKTGNPVKERSAANEIALNCIYGLLTLTQTCDHRKVVVGEAVTVMARILQLLRSDGYLPGDLMSVQDPNHVQDRAMRRIMMLLANTLNMRSTKDEEEVKPGDAGNHIDDDDDKSQPELSKLEKLSVNLPAPATSAALWIVGEFLSSASFVSPTFGTYDENGRARIRLECARLLARAFPKLDDIEKEQGIHFASKLLISKAAGVKALHDEGPLCEHILSMGRVDVNADVRDRARYESGIIRVAIGLKHDLDATDDLPSLRRNISLEDAKRILLGTKPASSSLPLEDNFSTHLGESGGFRFGTLSSLVGHRARCAYQPLPPWASKNSPSSLRDPPALESSKAITISRNSNNNSNNNNNNKPAAATAQQPSNQGAFYESSSTDEESSSESSSESGSDASSSDDDSSSSGSSDDESSESSNENDKNNNLLQAKAQGTQRRKIMSRVQPNGSSSPQSKSMISNSIASSKPVTLVEDASDSSADSDSDDDSSSGSSDDPKGKDAENSRTGNLIPMGAGSTNDSHVPNGFSSTSVADDMRGLVLSPVVTESAAASSLDPNFDRDSSAWIQLVRPEHAQGLSLSLRYLRGVTKAREAQLMGLMPEKPSVVCTQFRFENMSQTSGTVRRIRLMQKSSATSGSTVGPKKIVVPPEIDHLAPGQRTDCVVGIDFANPSDRDGSLQAKLDIKFGSGGIPIEIKPTLGDLLLPCQRSVADFDREMAKKQGFQRVESKFTVDPATKDSLPARFLRCAAMTPVGQKPNQHNIGWQDDTIRLAGTLPASLEPVYALVSGQGRIIVCSENALAANSIMNLLKRAAQTQ